MVPYYKAAFSEANVKPTFGYILLEFSHSSIEFFIITHHIKKAKAGDNVFAHFCVWMCLSACLFPKYLMDHLKH